jgi:hypothetical protein
MPYSCFFLEPTGQAMRWLRCYSKGPCPNDPSPYGYHDVEVLVESTQVIVNEDKTLSIESNDFAADPRWPTQCSCGYVFTHNDEQHVMWREVYRRQDTGEEIPMQMPMPVGSMWYADYYTKLGWIGPDGHCLAVETPGGLWVVDQPSTQGRPWQREGTPPKVTARPSINIVGRYHGWLTNGVLSDDLEQRR